MSHWTRRSVLGRLGAAALVGPAVALPQANAGAPKRRGRTGLAFDPAFVAFEHSPGHPESPARAVAIEAALAQSRLAPQWQPIRPRADVDVAVRRVHTAQHVAGIRAREGHKRHEQALVGVGAALACVDAVCAGELANAFCASRPPGHHAENTGQEEGFCLYNNIAIAARHAQVQHRLQRVLIVDWDYHHGNGTETAFYDDASVLFFSTHDWHAYPRTGDPARRGSGAGMGFNINVHLPCGSGDTQILDAFHQQLLPAARAFKPELVLVSAGFDSLHSDPLGCHGVSTAGFVALTRLVMGIADEHAAGRLVSILEGGYQVADTAAAVVAHVETLAGLERR